MTDWPLAVLCVLVFLTVSAGIGSLLGVLIGVIVNGFHPEGFVGLLSGAWLPFAGLGADSLVLVAVDDGGIVWFSRGLALTITAAMVVLARFIYRAALGNVGVGQDFTLAFIAKVALLAAVTVAILGTVLSIGDIDDGSDDGFSVISQVGSAEPAWGALLLLGIVGLVVARDRITFPGWTGRLGWARPMRYGAAVWAVMVLALGGLGAVVAIVSSEDATEGLVGALVTPAVVGNGGVSVQAFAMGASNDTVGDAQDIDPTGDQRLDEQLSLFNYELPPDDDSDPAPVWLWPLLAVAPALSFLGMRRWLQRTQPTEASAILAGAATVAVGFALASWLGAVFSPLDAGGIAQNGRGGDFDFYARFAVARPSIGAVLGLALFWGLLGAMTAAALWARRHGIDLVTSSSSVNAGRATGDVQPAAAPPPSESDGGRSCPQCGTPNEGTPFCASCGARVEPPGVT